MDRPNPADYTPALGWWGHSWRVLVSLTVSALAWADVLSGDRDHPGWLIGTDLALGAAALVLVLFRRRWPMTVALLTAAMSMVSGLAAGPSLLAAVSLATRRVMWQLGVVGVASVLSGIVYNRVEPPTDPVPWLVNLGLVVAITTALLAFGMYVGSRRELLWSLRERARSAEDQQEMRVSAARSAERERIAREMHDVLGHRISMVSMHAGALAYRTDLPAAQVQETAELIQRTSHQALADLRQVLGALREDEDTSGTTTQPQPRLSDLPALVDEAREAGMAVALDLDVVDPDALSESLGRTVYRVVQEGLTNARKHATGCPVTVRVVGGPGHGVDVRVLNHARPFTSERNHVPGSGLGIVGLRERAELVGGRVAAGRQGEEFVLHGWLPWTT